MDTRRFAALTGLMAMLVFTNTGCFTLMGAGIGGAVDANKPDRFLESPGWQVDNLKLGTPITLSLQDSSRLSGKFAGVEQQSAEVYAQHYAAWQAQPAGAALPTFGDSITMIRSSGKKSVYGFQGFDYREGQPRILAQRSGRPGLETVELKKENQMVDSRGTALTVDEINRRFLKGQLPLRSAIMLIQQDTTRVAIDRVVSITRPFRKQGARTGAKIGGTIDGIVIFAALLTAGVYGLYILFTGIFVVE